MKSFLRGLMAAALLCLVGIAQGQVPQIINYQGRVLSGATNFNGTGQFKFALIDPGGGTTFWSNDGTSVAGSEPSSAVSLSVTNGLYSVLLGDTAIANMTVAIPFSAFTNSDVRLRVWFNDGTHGSQLLLPDQRIAAIGYAMMAVTAVTVPATSVTGTLGVTHGGTGSTTAGGALTSLGAAATSGTLAQFAPTTSAQLAGAVSNETGSGSLVFANGPILSTPIINSGMFVGSFIFVDSNDALTNGTSDVLALRHSLNGGVAASGIGAGIRFDLQNSSGLAPVGAEITALFSNATAGSEIGQLRFDTLSGGSIAPRLLLDNTAATFAARLLAPGGTAAGPGYSFASDTNTGMFLNALDTLNFATGGVTQMSISPAGAVSVGTVNVGAMNALGIANINISGTASTNIGNATGSITMAGTEIHSGQINANGGIKVGSTGDIVGFLKNVTATLDFPNTVANGCTDLTVNVPGAQNGDAVVVTPPILLCNTFFTARVTAADTVTVRFNNPGVVATDPNSGGFRIIVMR